MLSRIQSARQAGPGQADTEMNADQGGTSQPRQPAPQQPSTSRCGTSTQLLLSHLRIGNEADHELVNIPTARRRNFNPLRPSLDAATVHLTGTAYLRFLLEDETNNGMGDFFKAVIDGRYILGAANFSEERGNEVAERLRPIVAQCSRDVELRDAVDDLAGQALGRCGDGTQMFIGQMETLAILSAVKNGSMNGDDLYNLGVSFFKLDAVRTAVGRRTPPGLDMQNVHNTFNAEVGLQEELNLPTNHTTPFMPDMGFVNDTVLREISAEVKARLSANSGAEVLDYLSRWEPWQEFVMAQPEFAEDAQVLNGIFHRRLEKVERRWESRDTAPMTYEKYAEEINQISSQRTSMLGEFCGQRAGELLFNAKAAALIDRGHMLERFRQT